MDRQPPLYELPTLVVAPAGGELNEVHERNARPRLLVHVVRLLDAAQHASDPLGPQTSALGHLIFVFLFAFFVFVRSSIVCFCCYAIFN